MIDFSLRLQLSPNSQTPEPGELVGAGVGLGPTPEYWALKQFDLLSSNALRPNFLGAKLTVFSPSNYN